MRGGLARAADAWIPRIRAAQHVLLAVLSVWVVYLFLSHWAAEDAIAVDFHHYYWPAGDRVMHHLSPYVYGPWYAAEVPVGFVYPAPAAVLFAGVAVIPRDIGDVLFTALAIGAPLIALWLLDVSDWRLYALVLLWPPVLFGIQTANLSTLIVVALAGIWRMRDRPFAAGVILGVVVALKVFLFPLGLFLLASKRYGALGYAIGTACIVSVAAWVIVGLDEIQRYRATVAEFTRLREDYGYSVIGFVERLGGARPVAYAIAVALAATAALAAVVYARRGQEGTSFSLALSAGLLATPILWQHYLVMLLVPIALREPRLDPLWTLPILLFATPWVDPTTTQVGIALSLVTVFVALVLRRNERFSRQLAA